MLFTGRLQYFNYVISHINSKDYKKVIDNETLFIDKEPLNLIHIPLIQRLFPNAKIIFSLRHPIAVCLSNFQQNFNINTEMIKLITFDDCVARYINVMKLLKVYQKELSLNMHTIRYEDLVSDLPREAKKLFTFLNIQGNDEYLNFHLYAQNKFISTPSREQVNQPLYKDSIEKWQHYLPFLPTSVKKLDDFINEFGY